MTIPQWTLLCFALWTLIVLISTIGFTRIYLSFSGKVQPRNFRADEPHGSPLYRRAMRAHMNCVENLPIYGAIILCLTILKIDYSLLNTLAIIFILARVCQTVTHIAFTDTNNMVILRFTFFLVQIVIMFWMAILILKAGLGLIP